MKGESAVSERQEPATIIAHRGASAYRPEHTLAAYDLAIEQGADFIEPDLVLTRDGVLVARHENELSLTTDVALHPEYGARRTCKRIDGKYVEGWFTEDFLLAELKSLRTLEPFPRVRPQSTAFNNCFEIPTLEEILHLLIVDTDCNSQMTNHEPDSIILRCGLYPELKHPTFYAEMGFDMARLLLDTLRVYGVVHERERIFIQCFEVDTLKQLRRSTDIPLVQLIDTKGSPYDSELSGGHTYREMMMPRGLAEIATYADAIGPAKEFVAPALVGDADRSPALLEEAHRLGLLVHAWTFRAEPWMGSVDGEMRIASQEHPFTDELRRYLLAGLDGLFTDNPDIAVRTRDAVVAE
ncbi:MAG: glycerophosphodiester phosphodiesterase family protein [Rhodospirillales bacterium]